MYIKESSQQTFEIPNNNSDVRFEMAYRNHNNEILQATLQRILKRVWPTLRDVDVVL